MLALEPLVQDLSSLLKSPLTLGKAASNPTQSIRERLQIAQQNEQSAWMYAGSEQFIRSRDNAAARTQLRMLWNDAPYYGDPASLAKMVTESVIVALLAAGVIGLLAFVFIAEKLRKKL